MEYDLLTLDFNTYFKIIRIALTSNRVYDVFHGALFTTVVLNQWARKSFIGTSCGGDAPPGRLYGET